MFRARYRRIVLFFACILFNIVYWDWLLPRLRLRGYAERTRSVRLRRYAAAFRTLAVQMGGVMIKVGQFLSARVDVLPGEITEELAGLQDEVPAESFEDIRKAAEAEFGVPLLERFSEFEEVPLAAASLGQVHRARLIQPFTPDQDPDAMETSSTDNSIANVVVKIQRPDIEQIIATDLQALRTVGKWLQRYRPIRRRANVPALLAEFTRILYEEIDYLAEGRNAETFAANFKRDPKVRVPRVIWTHTTRRALTLENVWSIKITDYDQIAAAGVERSEVASRLLDTYLKQIFEDGFFHADPHPGNLFVNPLRADDANSDSVDWELVFVDFGMVGRVPTNLKAGLRELLVGVGTRDSTRVVKAYQLMDILLPGADLARLEQAEAKAFEHFWGKTMTELTSVPVDEMHAFADEFRDLIYEMPFQVPHNMIFLGRCVGILSGMCTGLDPQFNLWEHLVPYARKLVAEEARHGLDFWLEELQSLVSALLAAPRKIDTALSKLDRGEVAVRAPEVSHQIHRLERALYVVAGGFTFTGLLLGGIQLYLGGQISMASILLGGAALNLLWLLWRSRSAPD